MSLPFVVRPGLTAGLIVAVAAVTSVKAVSAQPVMDEKSAAELRTQFLADLDTVHVKIMALAEVIPEGKYTWSPTPETRTIANALMHVATEWYMYVPLVMGGKPPADFGAPRETIPKLEKIASKAEVMDHLKKSWAHAKQQVESADLAALLPRRQMFGQSTTFPQLALLMSGDLHEHLGQLITYARSVGEVPPWSRKPGS